MQDVPELSPLLSSMDSHHRFFSFNVNLQVPLIFPQFWILETEQVLKVKFFEVRSRSSKSIGAISIKESISNRNEGFPDERGWHNSGIPCIHTCIHIHYSVDYLILLHHYDCDAIYYSFLIIILLLPLSLLSPVENHRYNVITCTIAIAKHEERIRVRGATVIFKMVRHAGQINKRAYIYIHIQLRSSLALRYDEDDTIMMIQRTRFKVAPRLSFGCRSDPFYECEERVLKKKKKTCEREEWIKGLPFRIYELSRTIHLSDNSLDLCLV